MIPEYINYYVWPDGTWVSDADYSESHYLDMSDDWFFLPLPITLDENQVEEAVHQALQGVFPYA